jgi:oxygen-independent coproporphyrinogen-3 oxidase
MTASSLSGNIYVHVPFCDGKCSYCGFYSELYTPGKADLFLESLALEMDLCFRSRSQPAPATLYMGGGTPTVLSEHELARLCRLILDRVSTRNLREWTVEANPNTITHQKAQALSDAGVTRISLGVQSFNTTALKTIGRRHGVADVARATDIIRTADICNLGIDLIASLPGVDDQAWSATLNKAVSLKPQHISVYALSVEQNTELSRQSVKGTVIIPDDDSRLRATDVASETLESHGYGHYEISNYAQAGFECLHNLSCWRGWDYLALGPSASSRISTKRWTNVRDLNRYATALSEGQPPIHNQEILSREVDASERIMFTFRLKEGVDIEEFSRRADITTRLRQRWEGILARLMQDGMMTRTGHRWSLTPAGMRVADSIAEEFTVS